MPGSLSRGGFSLGGVLLETPLHFLAFLGRWAVAVGTVSLHDPVYLDYYNVPYCLLPFLQLSPYTESGEGQPTKVTHDWLGDLASVCIQPGQGTGVAQRPGT